MKSKILLKKLARYFPKSIAESYDHVGLQCGKIKEETNTVLLCLDYDEVVYQYIIDNHLENKIDMIISHHPFIFGTRAKVLKKDQLKKVLFEKTLTLNIPVYSYHTNFDGGNEGMNDALTRELGLVNIVKLESEPMARGGELIEEMEIHDFAKYAMKKLNVNYSLLINEGKTIIKKVDKEKTDELREWLIENNIDHGINIDEDTKRYYPFGNLASQVIGFCGSDNQGLDGIEARYDSTLKGEYGRIEKVIDATGGKSSSESESYVEAVDGKDLVLTIDMTVQSIAEKYLKNACIDNECTDGGNVIIMNPKTGDILAMAGYPNYNLNEPYEPYTDDLKAIWDTLSDKEQTTELQKVWRNKAIADTYEPGSVFKLLTASAAIEEGIAEPDKPNQYNCTGSIEVAGVRIRCWRYYRPHGSQSLRDALMNSCNPVFIGLGQTLGVEKYYEYLEKFGMLERTGIDLYGEAASIFLKEEKVGPVELATIAFGQRFEVTPIQMVRMVSVIANKGIEVKPRIVKEIRDSETGEVQTIPVEETGRVISEETANSVLSMMESVVAEGTGKGATVLGYRVGGKTGTSEDGVNTNKYIASFMGVAPIEDPEVVILATLYNPTGEGRSSRRPELAHR